MKSMTSEENQFELFSELDVKLGVRGNRRSKTQKEFVEKAQNELNVMSKSPTSNFRNESLKAVQAVLKVYLILKSEVLHNSHPGILQMRKTYMVFNLLLSTVMDSVTD